MRHRNLIYNSRNFLAGMIWLRPVPYGRDFQWWLCGSATSVTLICLSTIGLIFVGGFLVGRM